MCVKSAHLVRGVLLATLIVLGIGLLGRVATSSPEIVFLIHEDEYQTKETLPKFASEELEKPFGWTCVFLFGSGKSDFPDLTPIEDAGLLFVSVRRKLPTQEHLDTIRAYCASGRPIVGIRTASHAFASRDGNIPEGRAAWPEFDHDILGGNYHNHYGNKGPDEPSTYVYAVESASGHPILKGVRRDEFPVRSWLYKVVPLAESATPLLMGRVGDHLPHEPVAWTNISKYGSRVFYTSLGHPDDFEIPDFRRLLVNGIRWALNDSSENELHGDQ